MAIFKGIKQVTAEKFEEAKNANELVGYLWFVRTEVPETEGENDANNNSYDIYFGSKKYGHFQAGEIERIKSSIEELAKFVIDTIVENEEIIATSINDLNERVIQNLNNIKTLDETINGKIVENEEIIATSLNDLNERLIENLDNVKILDNSINNKFIEIDNKILNGGYIYIEKFDKENFQNALTLALQSLDDNESAIIDCTYFKGTHTISNGFIINNPVTLIFGDINVIHNNSKNSNLFTFRSNNISIQGLNRNTDKLQISNGATIFNMINADNTLEGYHIKSKGNKNIEIKNITMVGLRTTMGHQYNNSSYDINGVGGIYIEKGKPEVTEGGNTCNNIRIENILITGTKAHGIYIDTPILSSIKNVRISDCGGHGIFINGGTSILFENVYVSSSNMAGFCMYNSTYTSLNNCVTENSSIGFWLRSSFNVTLTSPGVEVTRNQGANPWRNSQPITGVYGLNLSTLSSDGTSLPISDVNPDASGYFRGYGILITGGKSINIFTPYIKSISQSVTSSGYPNGTDISNNVKYINIIGNARAVFILNPSFKETNSTVSSSIKHEIGIGEEVKNLELIYNTEQTTLSGLLDNLHYTTESNKRAPILLESQTSVIRNGKILITNYITDTPKEEQEIVNKSYVDELFNFVSTKEQTISDPDNTISLSTKITNIILNNADSTNLSFSHGGQNECTIVIYNKTGNSITLPTSFIIGNYTTVLVNKISSVTLLDKSSCEINVMFTNGECRILTIV